MILPDPTARACRPNRPAGSTPLDREFVASGPALVGELAAAVMRGTGSGVIDPGTGQLDALSKLGALAGLLWSRHSHCRGGSERLPCRGSGFPRGSTLRRIRCSTCSVRRGRHGRSDQMLARYTVRRARPPSVGSDALNERGTNRKPRARSSVDRASDFGSEGRGFESLRARHSFPVVARARSSPRR
jgi:hypothetical protein